MVAVPEKALQFLLLFTGLFGVVAGFTVIDQQRRESLEIVTLPTALGDDGLFEKEETFPPGAEVVRLGGKPLFRLSEGLTGKRAWLMQEGQWDDSKRWLVYRETLPKGSPRELNPNHFFLKIGKDQFLRLTSVPPLGG